MKIGPRYLLLGLCVTLIGASPAREKVSSVWSESPAAASQAISAFAAEKDGRLSFQAAGRRFEFGEGELAASARDSSWTYRFQGSRGGIRALSISSRPEQTAPGSLEYRHPQGIVERYIVQSSGVEQQFLLPGPYAGGDVLLTGSVETDLVPDKTSSFEGIAFRRGEDTELFYGSAKAVDAGGRTALLEERWADGELTLVVPGSFLASARFPVLVDPYIGRRLRVDGALDLAENPAVAANNNGFTALAVWSTNETSPQFIRGRIIGVRGNTIIGPISVVDEFSGAGTTYTRPRVAWSPADSVWVVAAEGHGSGVADPNFIQVNKVNTSGTKTTGTNLNAVPGSNLEQDVDVACNNAGLCLITWVVDRDASGTSDSVKGVFYTPATNTFGTIFAIFDGVGTRSHSRVASNGTDFYEVNTVASAIEGWSVSAGGTVVEQDSLSVSQRAEGEHRCVFQRPAGQVPRGVGYRQRQHHPRHDAEQCYSAGSLRVRRPGVFGRAQSANHLAAVHGLEHGDLSTGRTSRGNQSGSAEPLGVEFCRPGRGRRRPQRRRGPFPARLEHCRV